MGKTTAEQIEANKARAVGGWIADPAPKTEEPLPAYHEGKWRKIMDEKQS